MLEFDENMNERFQWNHTFTSKMSSQCWDIGGFHRCFDGSQILHPIFHTSVEWADNHPVIGVGSEDVERIFETGIVQCQVCHWKITCRS